MTDTELLLALDGLQNRYLRALGHCDMRAWSACFDQTASYICTTRENDDQQLGIALMMDDSFARIQDRVTYVTEVWKGTYEDYQPRHFVQRTHWSFIEPQLVSVKSNVLVMYTDMRGRSSVLMTGVYDDAVALQSDGALFRSKRAILDTNVTPRYLVYPV